MSKLETNTIDTVSGTTNLVIGSTNSSTVTFENGAVTGHNYPAFFVYDLHNVEQSLTGGTNTKLTPATEYYDTDNAYSSDKFTVPSGKGGKYRFYGGAEMKNNDGIGFCNLYLNGATVLASGDFFTSITSRYNGGTGSASDEAFCPVDFILNLSAGDYVELYMQVYNSGDVRKIQFGGYTIGA